MKFLISATFRDFNKKNKNYYDQKKFLNSILKQKKFDIDFAITQFKEKNVNQLIKQIPKGKCHYFNEKLPKNYRWSHSKVFINGLKIFCKKDYDYLIWSTTDIIITKKVFDYLSAQNKSSVYTFFPNINVETYNKTFFGIDFFAYKISKPDAKKLIKVLTRYENYDWGIFEHFLFSFSTYLKMPIHNLFEHGKIYKMANIKKSVVFNNQFISWKKNQKIFEKFLHHKKISILYSKGSMYYLALKLFKIKDLGFRLLFMYIKLFGFFIMRVFKLGR